MKTVLLCCQQELWKEWKRTTIKMNSPFFQATTNWHVSGFKNFTLRTTLVSWWFIWTIHHKRYCEEKDEGLGIHWNLRSHASHTPRHYWQLQYRLKVYCSHEMISHQGSQLVAASKDISDLTKDWDWDTISGWAGNNQIKWTIVSPRRLHTKIWLEWKYDQRRQKVDCTCRLHMLIAQRINFLRTPISNVQDC